VGRALGLGDTGDDSPGEKIIEAGEMLPHLLLHRRGREWGLFGRGFSVRGALPCRQYEGEPGPVRLARLVQHRKVAASQLRREVAANLRDGACQERLLGRIVGQALGEPVGVAQAKSIQERAQQRALRGQQSCADQVAREGAREGRQLRRPFDPALALPQRHFPHVKMLGSKADQTRPYVLVGPSAINHRTALGRRSRAPKRGGRRRQSGVSFHRPWRAE
jgi:hypothetical protein